MSRVGSEEQDYEKKQLRQHKKLLMEAFRYPLTYGGKKHIKKMKSRVTREKRSCKLAAYWIADHH